MGIFDRFRESRREREQERLVEKLQERVSQGDLSIDFLSEQLAELELALEDQGWVRLGIEGELDFSLAGIRTIIRMSRLMAIKNPLIKNGVRVQCDYVFGQGVEIKATDEKVNEVVQGTLKTNARAIGKHEALRERERDLQVEGQLFFALFVNSSNAEARIRFLPVLEVEDVICNPDDADEPWWYKRVWTEKRFSLKTASYVTETKTQYYRDWQIPKSKAQVQKIGDHPVAPDTWIYHLKVGALRGMKFGVPETYAAMDWARSYKDYLSRWASLFESLARFAWKLTGRKKQVRAAKTKLESTVTSDEVVERNPPPGTGSVAGVPEGMDLAPIPKVGSQVSADGGTQLRKMAAAGMGIPDPVMSNDPQQGTMATAKTLDRPTELAMRSRQMLWVDVFKDILGFIVARSVKAPNGRLREALKEAQDGDLDTTIEVNFPPVLERDIRESVRAIVDAYTAGGRPAAGLLPPELVTKLLMVALAVENPEKALEGFTSGELPETDPEVAEALKEIRGQLLELAEAVKAA